MSQRDPYPLGFRVTEGGQVVDLRNDMPECTVVFCAHTNRSWHGPWPDARLVCDQCASKKHS